LFGADTASSANTPADAEGEVGPGGVTSVLQGDINCDGVVNAQDALGDLRYVGGLEVQQTEPCPDVGTLAAIPGPAGPQGEQGLPGEQGPPGLTLFAHVNGDGVLEAGTAVSASKDGTGQFVVTFGQSILECVAVATVGRLGSGSFLIDEHVSASIPGPTDQDVFVRAFAGSAPSDTDFHLIVAC
jgi:hypothetical protein